MSKIAKSVCAVALGAIFAVGVVFLVNESDRAFAAEKAAQQQNSLYTLSCKVQGEESFVSEFTKNRPIVQLNAPLIYWLDNANQWEYYYPMPGENCRIIETNANIQRFR